MATFGKITDGSSVQTFSGDRKYTSQGTAPSSGTITSGWGRVRITATGTTKARMALYSDTAGAPDALLSTSDEVTVNWTTETLTQFPFSGGAQVNVVSGTAYWIAVFFKDPGTPSFEISRANTANLTRFGSDTYGPTPADPFNVDGSSNGALDLYIEYSEGGGGGVLTISVSDTVTVSETMTFGGTWLSSIQAWIYPGSPACNAMTEIADGRVIYILKPEYYRVNRSASGVIEQMTTGTDGCNGYSVGNAAAVKANSTKQFVTLSCGTGTNMNALCSDATKRTNAINTLITFLNLVGFTGVELDWEGFGGWTTTHYTNFLTWVSELSTALHANGYQLMIDGPAMIAAVDVAYGQNLFKFKYEDVTPYCDYVVMLSYDYQYDYGAGQSIAPTTFVQACCDWMLLKVVDLNKIVLGLPSYGYHGTTDGFTFTLDTKAQSAGFTGYGTATRNGDYEMTWVNAGTSYIFQDSAGMNSKRSVIEAKGVTNISVWHLGGNDWFTGKSEPSGGVQLSSISDSVTISESVTMRETSYVNLSDSVTITENVTMKIPTLYLSVFDNVFITDFFNSSGNNAFSNLELVTISENVNLFVTKFYLSVFDSVTVSESVTAVGSSMIINLFDSVSVTENIAWNTISYINVFDSAQISENISARLASKRSHFSSLRGTVLFQ